MTVLFTATGDGVARIEIADGGARVTTLLSEPGVQCLAAGDRSLYAGSRGRGVWKSEDGGESWEQLNFPQPDVFSVAVGRADGAVYAGCEPSMLFTSDDGGGTWHELAALREIPSAPTWSFPPRPWTSHVRWIAPSPHDAGLLLAGIELGGLMRSEDGGETWSDHRAGAQKDVHCLAWHPSAPGRAYEAAGGGAAWSFDGGESWDPADAGRDRHYAWALAVDPDEPDRWFVSASTGPFAAHGRRPAEAFVYRWTGEGPWEPLLGPLDSMPYALAFAGGHLVAGLADGTLSASDDRGDSWRELKRHGDALPRVLAFADV